MRKIPVGNGKYTLVDDRDYDYLSQFIWKITHGYVNIDLQYSEFFDDTLPENGTAMSRIILGLLPNDGFEADHINHNLLDNRRNNLRKATHSQNQCNRTLTSKGSSKYKGVSWNKGSKKWQAQIGINKQTKYLGVFDNENHAAHVYNLAAKRYFGEFALLNKIIG